MTPAKRLMDLVLALLLALVLWLPILLIALAILILDGRPVFFRQERMKAPDRSFRLVKFRTMRVGSDDHAASGGHKNDRVTPFGRFLRRYRLDELPQLWNILRGDISFVGPRPPLRRYVELRPDLYARVLQSRPGLTGLATLVYRRREAALLSACKTAEENDAVYTRRCVPTKARLDIIYGGSRSICYDMLILVATISGRSRPFRSNR
ncbi:MAG: sugar transferase [Pseudooceanicola sp.]